jgi:hypothetical protein
MATLCGQTETAVTVLAGWEDEEPGEVQSLVVFDGWSIVKALYALVNSQAMIQRAIRRSGAFRVLGANIEVDSPGVQAWLVEDVGYLSESVALGEGLLLSERESRGVRRGRELAELILEVRDDGMLLVKAGDAWATIDLTALAAEAP